MNKRIKKSIEFIFSVRNSVDRKYKVLTVCGLQIRFRRIFYFFENMFGLNEQILELVESISRKLSMPDSIFQFDDVRFYVPYYPIDLIQRHIVNTKTFFEQEILELLDKYIPENSVIFDIGANIGNHSIYWGIRRNVSKIYAFEPVRDTFEILKRNIELNGLKDKVVLYNIGLSDKKGEAGYVNYRMENIGSTHLKPLEKIGGGGGDMQLCTLDDMTFPTNRIDFIKIDVESMEILLLKGASKFFKHYKPSYIFIEVEEVDNEQEVDEILLRYGYRMLRQFEHHNFLYTLAKE